jgi:hypothetical protein
MARGNSSRASSERSDNPFNAGSPQKTEADYHKDLVSHFKTLASEGMGPDDIGEIPDEQLQGIAESVAGESSDTRDQRDEFDSSVEAGQEALKNAKFDWEDKRMVANLVPLTFSEVQDGLEPADVLQSEWEDWAQTDPDVYEAQQKDREYEDDEGEPASLRGNSAVDAQFAIFAKGFIKDRIESASANREDYDDEINTIEADALEENVNEWRDNR